MKGPGYCGLRVVWCGAWPVSESYRELPSALLCIVLLNLVITVGYVYEVTNFANQVVFLYSNLVE